LSPRHAERTPRVRQTGTDALICGKLGKQLSTPRPKGPDRAWLRAQPLTGLAPTQWDALIERLRVARHAQREAHLHARRGHDRHAAAGTGRKAVLTLDDRVAITVLYQRFSPPQRTLALLFGVAQQTIYRVIRQTRPLLSVIGHTSKPTGTRLVTPAELVGFAAEAGIPVPEEPKSTRY